MKKFILILMAAAFMGSCGNGSGKGAKTGDSTATADQAVNPFQDHAVMNHPDGDYVEKYGNGIIKIRGYIAGGMRHGQWASFYPSGELWSEVFYHAGKRHGATASYYQNGKPRYKGFYRDNAEAGKWQYWDETGKLAQEVDYDNRK